MGRVVKLSDSKKQDNPMLTLNVPTERRVDAELLPQVIDAYIASTERSITPKVLYNYQYHLAPFQQWWQKFPDQHKNTISPTTLQKFVDWYGSEYRTATGLPTSEHMMDKTLALIRRVLRWAHQQGAIGEDVSHLVPQKPSHPKPKYYPKIEELDRLVKAPADPYLGIRDTTIMAMLLATGCRRFELANAQIENVHFNTSVSNLNLGDDHGGYIHFRVVKGDSEGKGLGRYSVFHWKAGLLLKACLRWTRKTSGSLFGLTDDGIRQVVTEAGVLTGITRIHPHAFRSSFIDYWFWKHRNSGDAADVARRLQVGHAMEKGDVTMHYINLNPDRQLELIKEFYCSPLEEIKIDWWKVPVHTTGVEHYL